MYMNMISYINENIDIPNVCSQIFVLELNSYIDGKVLLSTLWELSNEIVTIEIPQEENGTSHGKASML